jgi:hypothetical protein
MKFYKSPLIVIILLQLDPCIRNQSRVCSRRDHPWPSPAVPRRPPPPSAIRLGRPPSPSPSAAPSARRGALLPPCLLRSTRSSTGGAQRTSSASSHQTPVVRRRGGAPPRPRLCPPPLELHWWGAEELRHLLPIRPSLPHLSSTPSRLLRLP